jgi:chromate transporter
MKEKNILAGLFITFMKIGAFTFGGGYAMIALMENECVEKRKWITHDELINMTVIAESTPGPISLNCATFIGYRQAGLSGASIATIALVIPSFVILYLISLFFDNLLEITIVANAFKGIKIAVGVLIFIVAINMYKKMPKKKLPLTIMACSFTALLLVNIFNWGFSTIYMILISGLIGYLNLVITQIRSGKGKSGK